MFDHFLARGKISLFGQRGKMNFFLDAEQRPQADLIQIMLGCIRGKLCLEQGLKILNIFFNLSIFVRRRFLRRERHGLRIYLCRWSRSI